MNEVSADVDMSSSFLSLFSGATGTQWGVRRVSPRGTPEGAL